MATLYHAHVLKTTHIIITKAMWRNSGKFCCSIIKFRAQTRNIGNYVFLFYVRFRLDPIAISTIVNNAYIHGVI